MNFNSFYSTLTVKIPSSPSLKLKLNELRYEQYGLTLTLYHRAKSNEQNIEEKILAQ